MRTRHHDHELGYEVNRDLSDERLWEFAELDWVLGELKPVTHHGARAAARRVLITDEAELAVEHDRISAMMQLLVDRNLVADQLTAHLRRIPVLPHDLDAGMSPADFFQVKALLIHTAAIAGLLEEETRELFGVSWRSEKLLGVLNPRGTRRETFFLSDEFAPELAGLRKEIDALETRAAALRSATLHDLKQRHGLDFSGRDFLVVNSQQASELRPEEVYVEPFDRQHLLLKPVFDDLYFELLAKRDRLVQEETEIEQDAMSRLAEGVLAEHEVLEEYALVAAKLDFALAKARLAKTHGMVRPEIASLGEPLVVDRGEFLPLKALCESRDIPYEPLNIEFDTRHALIYGSNMSGKTVAMKTIVCLQVLTQLGFFVPADRYRTGLFGKICVIGGGGAEAARGLSSFALEMLELHRAVVHPSRPKLYVADEFARTTNSREARALITGLLSGLDRSESAYSMIATHYLSLEDFDSVRRYRMKGLDWPAINAALQAGDVDLAGRIKIINRCVTYEIMAEETQNPTYDALAIAELLGVDASIIDVARRHVGKMGTPEPEPAG